MSHQNPIWIASTIQNESHGRFGSQTELMTITLINRLVLDLNTRLKRFYENEITS